jgi:hypothetical protein
MGTFSIISAIPIAVTTVQDERDDGKNEKNSTNDNRGYLESHCRPNAENTRNIKPLTTFRKPAPTQGNTKMTNYFYILHLSN